MENSFLGDFSDGQIAFGGYSFEDIDETSQRVVTTSVADKNAFRTDEERTANTASTASEDPTCVQEALDWSFPPAKEVSKEGNVRCVTKFLPVPPKEARSKTLHSPHKVHLQRTVEIAPQAMLDDYIFPSDRHKQQQIKVTEHDFHQYSHDIEQLRKRQMSPWSASGAPAPIALERDKSFKSKYRERCLTQTSTTEAWQNVEDMSHWQPSTSNEAGMNQVWLPPTPKNEVRDESKRAPDIVRVARSNSPAARTSPATLGPVRARSSDRREKIRSEAFSRQRSRGASPFADAKRALSIEPSRQASSKSVVSSKPPPSPPMRNATLPPLPRKLGDSRL